jgi:protein-S-isoprenylcysteine O-methyltransferase Ste14/Co/Zn/Cd efflux system component
MSRDKNTNRDSARRSRRRRKGHEYGQSWMLAAALLDGPRTIEDLEEYYRTMGHRFGLFVHHVGRSMQEDRRKEDTPHKTGLRTNLERSLQILLKRGWAREQDRRYYITDEGRREAHVMLRDLERGGRLLQRATRPETVSTVTLIVHFVLAAIKLPAALLSGSVGLLNDSLDTLMDGVSSLFVFFGVRAGRERLVSYVLLSFMTVTGGYTLYEALIGFFRHEALGRDWTAFAAVVVSAALCALLWLYQRYSGLKHSCVPLIAQSIDSRNHIIVAGGVTAGLVAAYFEFTIVDRLVGLAVAVLILKGAVELLIDLVRSEGEEEIDLSRYGFSRLEKHRRRQMVLWFLFEADRSHISTRDELFRKARAATDYSRIASLRALGLDGQPDREKRLEESIQEVFEKGWVAEVTVSAPDAPSRHGTLLKLTDAGEAELNRALARGRDLSTAQYPFGRRGGAWRPVVVVVRLVFNLALFTGIYALGRWVIGFLPPLDAWDTATFVASVSGGGALTGTNAAAGGSWLQFLSQSLATILLARTYTVGPFSLSGAQGLCALIGLSLLYQGRVLLHRGRHAIHHAREHRSDRPFYLVTDGVFSARRHPMYTGMILINMGIGIGLHSGYSLASAGLVTIVQLASASREERKLLGWFGREFRDYRDRVKRRLLPWWGWVLVITAYCAAWTGV